jgi:hypothetical protein
MRNPKPQGRASASRSVAGTRPAVHRTRAPRTQVGGARPPARPRPRPGPDAVEALGEPSGLDQVAQALRLRRRQRLHLGSDNSASAPRSRGADRRARPGHERDVDHEIARLPRSRASGTIGAASAALARQKELAARGFERNPDTYWPRCPAGIPMSREIGHGSALKLDVSTAMGRRSHSPLGRRGYPGGRYAPTPRCRDPTGTRDGPFRRAPKGTPRQGRAAHVRRAAGDAAA